MPAILPRRASPASDLAIWRCGDLSRVPLPLQHSTFDIRHSALCDPRTPGPRPPEEKGDIQGHPQLTGESPWCVCFDLSPDTLGAWKPNGALPPLRGSGQGRRATCRGALFSGLTPRATHCGGPPALDTGRHHCGHPPDPGPPDPRIGTMRLAFHLSPVHLSPHASHLSTPYPGPRPPDPRI